jgi:hypothetical protein
MIARLVCVSIAAVPTLALADAIFVNQFHSGQAATSSPNVVTGWDQPTRRIGTRELSYLLGNQPTVFGSMEWDFGLIDPQTASIRALGQLGDVPMQGGFWRIQNSFTTEVSQFTPFTLRGLMGIQGLNSFTFTQIEPSMPGLIGGVPTDSNGAYRITAAIGLQTVDVSGTLAPGMYTIRTFTNASGAGSSAINDLVLTIPSMSVVGTLLSTPFLLPRGRRRSI